MSFEVTSRSAPNSRASDPKSLTRIFGDSDGLLPLWIAEPYVALSPTITKALEDRAAAGWYGYETRSDEVLGSFWAWMTSRHGWSQGDLQAIVSPSVGTSIGVLIEALTNEGEGVILQPPVYTGFKPLVSKLQRSIVRNALVLKDDGYRMDLADLEFKASDPATKMMILCNPHNPVGRVWTPADLEAVADICSRHGVFVLADEIHADIILPPHRFTPFASVTTGVQVRWAATHGPIKTFGLAGVCDTLIVTDDEEIIETFGRRSSQLHLTRNNVFGMAALEAGYRAGGPWLDGFIDAVSTNFAQLERGLPDGIELVEPEGTYLAWLDFRGLGMNVPELRAWLSSEARLALSLGHWFGREGAGFARMTVAARPEVVDEAIGRLVAAVDQI